MSCKTSDGLQLHGLLRRQGSVVLMHTHGTASSFGIEDFETDLDRWAGENGFGFLTCNNRGAHVMEDWQKSGAALEKFSESPEDLKAWISMLSKIGVNRIIISGHSLGTEKIAHFLRNFEAPQVVSALLLAPSDSYGCQKRWEDEEGINLLSEARSMVAGGRGGELLDNGLAHAGLLPMSAEAYIDFFGSKSALRRALPLGSDQIHGFDIPVLALIPDDDIWNLTSADEYKVNLRGAGVHAEVCHTNHEFSDFDLTGKLIEFGDHILGGLKK